MYAEFLMYDLNSFRDEKEVVLFNEVNTSTESLEETSRPVQEFSQNENGFLLPSRPQPHHMSPSTNQVPDRQTTFEGTSQYRMNSAVQHSNTGRNTETRCSGHVNDHINKVVESVQNSRASRQTNFRNGGSIAEQDTPSLGSTRSVDDCSPERNIAQRQAEKVPTSIQTEQQQRTPSFPPRSRLPTHDRQHESHRSRNNSQDQHSSSESYNHRIEHSTRAVPSNVSQGPPRLDEGIIFPDSKQFIPNVANGEPSCANGTTFCVNLDDYPSAHLKKILKKEAKVYKELFGNDVFSDQLDPVEDIKMRFGEEQELCRYREEVVFPKVGMTKDKRWMFIANTEEIKQGVRVEICEKPDNPCSMTQGFPIGYVTSCRQKYVIRKMLSLEGDGSPTQDDFWFPSCCACHVVLSTEVESRMLSSGGPKLGK
uniref:Spaetzle domain-containing protein n=1 Tax=Timema monikensis TaxID=170555 RepID=A0A7R9EBK6_9NEOP|nr:unnamed protein product [Timema monikensis]